MVSLEKLRINIKDIKKVRIEIDQIDKVVTQIKENFDCKFMNVIANEIIVEIIDEACELKKFIRYISNINVIDNYQVQSLNIEEIIAHYYSELDI